MNAGVGHAELPLPLGSEQIFPRFRRLLGFKYLMIVVEAVRQNSPRRHSFIRVEKLFWITFGCRRIEHGKKLFLIEGRHHDLVSQRDIERRLSSARFSQGAVDQFSGVATPML